MIIFSGVYRAETKPEILYCDFRKNADSFDNYLSCNFIFECMIKTNHREFKETNKIPF